MNTIKIYYYTAWNGYSWQGCDDATAASLQRYMEASGVLPGDPGREPPFGGAIACQVGNSMGVAVYKCGVRERGDAFGRDSLFIALAFVPLEYGPADFSAIMSLPQMSPSVKGELVPVSVSLSDIALPSVARKDGMWRDESFTMRFSGIAGLRDASTMFFTKSCQLGLLQASFASDTGSVAGVSVSVSYRVFPEVAALAEASRAYADAKKLSRGTISDEHPVSMKLWDAINQLQTRRIDKMPGYTGLLEYLTERDAELGGVIARASAHVRRTPVQRAAMNAETATSYYAAPCAARRARSRSGRQSWLSYALVTVGLAFVAGFAILMIAERFSSLKTKRDEDVRCLQEEIRKLKSKCIEDIDIGKQELDNSRKYWQEEKQRLKIENHNLGIRVNNAESSNRWYQVQLKKTADKLTEAERNCRLYVAATNSAHQKHVKDIMEIAQYLSRAASEYAGSENVPTQKLTDIDTCKLDAKNSLLAIIKVHRSVMKKNTELENEAKLLQDALQREKDKVKALESSEASRLTPRSSVETPTARSYEYDINKDASPHSPKFLGSCNCWRCLTATQLRTDANNKAAQLEKDANNKADQLKKEAESEAKRLNDEAAQLEGYLTNLQEARNKAYNKKARNYAPQKFNEAEKAYNNAKADDIKVYIAKLEDAKKKFDDASAEADKNREAVKNKPATESVAGGKSKPNTTAEQKK